MAATATVTGYDCMGSNVGQLPLHAAVVGGYSTGTGPVPWSEAQWAAYPDALRYDQDPSATDPSADVLDVERGAATFGDIGTWERRAWADFEGAVRPGQRQPAVYCSYANRSVATAQMADPATGLVLAWWGIPATTAAALVGSTVDGHPVVGVQYASLPAYDVDVYSQAWLDCRSGQTPPTPPDPPPVDLGGIEMDSFLAVAAGPTAKDVEAKSWHLFSRSGLAWTRRAVSTEQLPMLNAAYAAKGLVIDPADCAWIAAFPTA